MVSDLLSGETLILADGGEGGSDDETSGGGGYSGGGGGSITGYPGGDGGSDGADGEHSPFSSDGGNWHFYTRTTMLLESVGLHVPEILFFRIDQ